MIRTNILGGVKQYKTQMTEQGYALPTVLIAGLVLLTIGASGMQVVASTTRAINDQYWNTLASQAKESGLKYAQTCLKNSSDEKDPTRPWTNPITQNTDCQGTALSSPVPYVESKPASGNTPAWRTSFTISNPSVDSTLNKKVSRIVGAVEILGASNNVVRTYTTQSTIIFNITGAQIGVQVEKISYGALNTCVLLTNKKVYCAGDSSNGQVGQGSGYYATPVDIGPFPNSVKADDVTVNSYSDATGETCIRGDDSQIYCIGYNTNGNFGNGSTTTNNPLFSPTSGTSRFGGTSGRPVKSSPIVNGTANYVTTCAIGTDDAAYCAGYNANYQLGDGSTTSRNYPVLFDVIPAPAGQKVIKIIPFVETYTICVLTDAGKVYCHGNNSSGQVGVGTPTANLVTTSSGNAVQAYSAVTTEGAIVDFGAGDEKSCALYATGALFCSGRLPHAALSIARGGDVVRFGGDTAGKQYSSFSIGPTSICAVETSTSDVYCVSKNDGGELGDGTTTAQTTLTAPVKIAGSGKYIPADPSLKLANVYVGDRKICLRYNVAGSETTTGFMTCAGYNQYGQFGNGTNNSGSSNMQMSFGQPFIMPSGVGVRDAYINRGMSVGTYQPTVSEHSVTNAATPICVRGTDGNAYCAGRNDRGQLGNTTTVDQFTPVRFVLPIDP